MGWVDVSEYFTLRRVPLPGGANALIACRIRSKSTAVESHQAAPEPPKTAARWRLVQVLPAVIALVAGGVLTLVLYGVATRLESRQLQERFDRQVETHFSAIDAKVRSFAEVLYTLRIVFDSSEDVSRIQFQNAARDLLSRRPEIKALEWVPQISRDQRAACEAQARADGLPTFEFTERQTEAELHRAGDRTVYWPILYVEPVKGNERALGFDLTVGPTRADLQKAVRDGDIVITSRIRLVQMNSQTNSARDFGLVAILPVFERGKPHRTRPERQRAFRGFVQAVFQLHDMMESGFERVPTKGQDVLVIDQTADSTNRLLHFHSSEMRAKPVEVTEAIPFTGYLARSVDWRVGGHKWTYSFRPSPEWLASQRTWTAEIALSGGILLTLSLTALVNVLSRRTMVVERQVDDRTVELIDANTRLESEVQHRKKTETALRRSESRMKAAQHIARVGSWESTPSDGAVRWSDETYEIFGLNPGLHRPSVESFFASVHPDDRAGVQAAAARSMASGQPYAIEHRIIRPDGSICHLAEHAEVVMDDKGRVVKLHGTVQDITDRKQSEAEKEALDHKIQETQKLESLGVLAGGIAHDFNNLLTVILGNASLARMDLPPDSPVHTCLQQIEQTSQRAAELCRQMLAYSGKGKFVVQRIDLSQLIDDATPLLRLSVTKKAVLRLNLAQRLPAVLVDATQIRQIIMNLVINASDALGDQSGAINLSTGLMRADRHYLSESRLAADLPVGDYVFLEISDTGCGMSTETLAKIFDPFFTTKFTGRGLGLAATLGIVRGHKGAIHVTSEAGRGSTFKLLLPAVDGRPELVDQTPAAEDSWRGTGTVLVVDDEETVRTVAARMIESFGFKAVLAVDGREAVARFAEDPSRFVAVLLDLTMPQMGGDEAFRAMRQLRPDVQVILMSGFNEPEAAARLEGQGWAAFVQKPFAIETLREILRSLPKS